MGSSGSKAAAVAAVPHSSSEVHGHTAGSEPRGSVAAITSCSPVRSKNTIETIYDEDFEHVDHVQALRFPPMVKRELQNAADSEAERRCMHIEKVMARCLQDKMWTAWKCQKERDRYYQCVHQEKQRHDLLNEYRWKYNLGTLHGEVFARNTIMKRIWNEHFPERELPHPWVKD